eukprot:s3534_g1.t1
MEVSKSAAPATKNEVIEDPEGVKRLGHHALYLGGSGRKLDVQCILKLLGFVGDPSNDRVMKIKELVGFWVNDDPRRYVVAEPVSVMATNFGGATEGDRGICRKESYADWCY